MLLNIMLIITAYLWNLVGLPTCVQSCVPKRKYFNVQGENPYLEQVSERSKSIGWTSEAQKYLASLLCLETQLSGLSALFKQFTKLNNL